MRYASDLEMNQLLVLECFLMSSLLLINTFRDIYPNDLARLSPRNAV